MRTEFYIYRIETKEDLELFKYILEYQQQDKDKVFVFDVTMPSEDLVPKFEYYVYFERMHFLQKIKDKRLIERLINCPNASYSNVTLNPNDPRRIYEFNPVTITLKSDCLVYQPCVKKYIFNIKTWADLKLLKRLLRRQTELPDEIIIFDLTKSTKHVAPKYEFCIYLTEERDRNLNDVLINELKERAECESIELCNIDFDDPRRVTIFEEYTIE